MANVPSPPPPRFSATAGAPPPARHDAMDPGRLVGITVAVVAIAVVLGCLIGYGVAVVTYMRLGEEDPSGWDLLGDALVALAFGVVTGALTYVAVAIAAIVRWVPTGSRMWPILAALVGPPALFLALRVLGGGLL